MSGTDDASSSSAGAFGVPRDFREKHGESAFQDLARFSFNEADVDKSGSIDKSELRGALKKLGIRLTGQTAAILTHYVREPARELTHIIILLIVGR